MAALSLCFARRLFSSRACLNRNRVVYRAFSTTDPTQQPPIIDQVGVKESLLKEAKGSEIWGLFKSWMLKYNKNYKSEEETLYRYKLFCKSKKEVEMLNKKDNGCTYALNFFADMTKRDFTLYNGKLDYTARACARGLARAREGTVPMCSNLDS